MEPAGNDCGDSPALNPDSQSAAEHQRGGATAAEEEKEKEVEEEEEAEEDKQEEACSPSPPANEQVAKRRACRKRRRSLFTIQAVNSNGVTERAMGEGCSAVSFGCECACVRETAAGQISNRK